MIPVIYTCGHGARSFEELVALLKGNDITLLIDVRAVPRSRFHPQFNRTFLETHLPMPYLWLGERLGGKNAKQIPPELFDIGIRELIEYAKGETVCIMCSERAPGPTKWRREGCHRWAVITPALKKRGVTVVHV